MKLSVFISLVFSVILLSSCSRTAIFGHRGTPPSEEGCGQCHKATYKDWNIAYKPYEQVPVPGSGERPGVYYHERRFRPDDEGKSLEPAKKGCPSCHSDGKRKPEGNCTRGGIGFK